MYETHSSQRGKQWIGFIDVDEEAPFARRAIDRDSASANSDSNVRELTGGE
jgi:hypothetical protein